MPPVLEEHIMAKIYTQLFVVDRSVKEIATEHGVSERAVRKWRQNWELFGTPRPPTGGVGGSKRTLTRAEEELVLDYLGERPTAYLDEVAWYIFDDFGKEVSVSTVSRTLRSHGWSRKVCKKVAYQRSEVLRAQFFAKRLAWSPQQLIFVDESACCPRTGDRKFGWSPISQRTHDIQVLERTKRWSVLPAISVDGYLRDPLIVQGSVTAELFNDWMINTVVPQCGPDTIFLMDNASIHRSDGFKELISNAGMQLEYLPPYSPDLNPIEQSFNVLKAWIRRHIEEARHYQLFGDFLEHAVSEISKQSAQGWFHESGYEIASCE